MSDFDDLTEEDFDRDYAAGEPVEVAGRMRVHAAPAIPGGGVLVGREQYNYASVQKLAPASGVGLYGFTRTAGAEQQATVPAASR